MNDPGIRKWMSDGLPSTPKEIKRWLHNATHDERRHYFDILRNGEVVGLISLRQDQKPEHTGEIGIIIGNPDDRSRGIGKAAVSAMLSYAKDAVGLSSVRAMIKPTNEKSIRLFRGAGFVPTGRVTIDGTPMLRFEKIL